MLNGQVRRFSGHQSKAAGTGLCFDAVAQFATVEARFESGRRIRPKYGTSMIATAKPNKAS